MLKVTVTGTFEIELSDFDFKLIVEDYDNNINKYVEDNIEELLRETGKTKGTQKIDFNPNIANSMLKQFSPMKNDLFNNIINLKTNKNVYSSNAMALNHKINKFFKVIANLKSNKDSDVLFYNNNKVIFIQEGGTREENLYLQLSTKHNFKDLKVIPYSFIEIQDKIPEEVSIVEYVDNNDIVMHHKATGNVYQKSPTQKDILTLNELCVNDNCDKCKFAKKMNYSNNVYTFEFENEKESINVPDYIVDTVKKIVEELTDKKQNNYKVFFTNGHLLYFKVEDIIVGITIELFKN